MTSVDWPADFPAGCPPEETPNADGTYYRIAKNNPPKPRDFESLYHKDKTRAKNQIRGGKTTKCDTLGLSVYTDMEDAIQCAKRYPNLGRVIVRLTLIKSPAKAALTKGLFDSHHTLWIPKGFDLAQHSLIAYKF